MKVKLNRTTSPPRTLRGPAGFTLVELLTIIIILSMLITLSTPSILIVRRNAKVKMSYAAYRVLEGGIEAYRSDDRFGRPPPSAPGDKSNYTDYEGRYAIVQFMIGWMNEAKDGAKGNGFRWREGDGSEFVKGGVIYGPYGGCENLQRAKGTPHPVFVDSFGNEILYYRFSEEQGYVAGHNGSADPEGPTDLKQYTEDQVDPNHAPYRSDYILITGGPDKKYKDVTDGDTDVDDITNFRFRLREK